jgi:pyruvate dehydrogenase E2 component (dihydrolipoamide acetyltransferase)
LTGGGSGAAPTAAPAKPAAQRPAPQAAPKDAEVSEESRAEEQEKSATTAPVASPSLRRIARELGINLGKVRGTGSGGRIEMGDLRAYIQRLESLAAKGKTSAPGAAAPAKAPAEQIDFSKWGPVSKKPMTQLRQVIARRMWENWNAIPHVTQFDDADFTRLNDLRKKFAAAYEQKGAKLTLTPLVLKAVADTLKKHPIFNSSLDEVANEIVIKEYIHIGIAVDTEAGLIVPVLRDVDKKSVLDIAKELDQLAQKARDRKLSADELKGGTFTISNQGAIGGAHFTPIVNKPEVAILGMGRGAMKPVVRGEKIEARMMTPLALSYDHRVIDGGSAARFIVELVNGLQDFKEEAVKI